MFWIINLRKTSSQWFTGGLSIKSGRHYNRISSLDWSMAESKQLVNLSKWNWVISRATIGPRQSHSNGSLEARRYCLQSPTSSISFPISQLNCPLFHWARFRLLVIWFHWHVFASFPGPVSHAYFSNFKFQFDINLLDWLGRSRQLIHLWSIPTQ